jgi:hypothetical protein
MKKVVLFLMVSIIAISFGYSSEVPAAKAVSDQNASFKFVSGNSFDSDGSYKIELMAKKSSNDGTFWIKKYRDMWLVLAVLNTVFSGICLTLGIIGSIMWGVAAPVPIGLNYGFVFAGWIAGGIFTFSAIVFWVLWGLARYFAKHGMLKDKMFISDKEFAVGIRL